MQFTCPSRGRPSRETLGGRRCVTLPRRRCGGRSRPERFRQKRKIHVSCLAPSEFVTKMVDAGQSKVLMSTRDTLIRSFMGGALLALGAVFAVTVSQQTGHPIIGAILFPVGFCTLYLHGYDLLTGVFVLDTVAWLDKRPRFTLKDVARNWGLVFVGNFLGALTVAVMMAIVFTF